MKEGACLEKQLKDKVFGALKALALPVCVFLIIVVLTKGRFGTSTSILSLLRTTVLPILIGMSMSFGMSMGMWNFSTGAVIYESEIFGAQVANHFEMGIPGVCLFTILFAVLMNVFTGFLYNKLRVPCLVLSLGMVMVYEALPALLTVERGGAIKLTDGYLAASPWCYLILIIAYAIFYYINNYTTLGADMRAIGANIVISNNAGLNIDRVKFVSFLISGVFMGVAAILYLSTNITVKAVFGFQSVSVIFDGMMGIFVAGVLTKYIHYDFAFLIGIFTIRMLGSGLVAMGLPSEIRSVMTGVFLFIVLTYSANSGLMERRKQKKVTSEAANAEYAKMQS